MIHESFYGVLIFLVGLCAGSFLNVVAVRLPRGRSVSYPRSRCGCCRAQLKWYENIPVLSYFILKGACGRCFTPYSPRYIVIEFLTGVLFLSLWYMYGLTSAFVVYTVFASILLVMSFIDLELRIIPDSLSVGAGVAALIFASLSIPGYPIGFWSALIGAIVGLGGFYLLSRVFYFITHEEGLGGGDVKLMLLIGAVLGIQGVATTVIVGSVLGMLAGIGYLVFAGKQRHFPIPFGPFLAIGALFSLFGLDATWWIY